MDTIEAIRTRRSIRKYTEAQVPDQVVSQLLTAAFLAPSAGDARPWHFTVVNDRQLLVDMADKMPGCDMLREATLGILVSCDPKLEEIPGFWPQDCAVATEHILLTAHALELGGCWIGLYPVEDRVDATREILDVPKNIIPFALCSLGYPNEELPPEDREDKSKLHRNKGW